MKVYKFVLFISLIIAFVSASEQGIGIYSVPAIGPALAWQGAWEFAHKLRILTKRKVPLAKALRVIASGLHDPNYADVAVRLAAGEENGLSLYEQLHGSHIKFPRFFTGTDRRRPASPTILHWHAKSLTRKCACNTPSAQG